MWSKLTDEFAELGHTRIMAAKSEMLTSEEFASLLRVGNQWL
jgi:hypothetical protein